MTIDFSVLAIDNIRISLTTRQEKLAVAESVTAGFLQGALSTAQDASMFYEGGLTAYNLQQKVRHLKVDKSHAASCNCVSGKTAGEMAIGVAEIFESEWGIAITGYASPVKESNFQLFAYVAVSYKGKIKKVKRLEVRNQDSTAAQIEYTQQVLDELEKVLAGS